VDLSSKTCSCRQWQIRGQPCIHALFFMTLIGGEIGEVDQYVSEYFFVAKFKVTYAENVPALLGKDQWTIIDPGFKLHAPVLVRPPGRPRKNRIRSSAEGGTRRRRKCKRCGGLGHIARICTNPVDPSFGEDDQWGAKNAEDHEALEEGAEGQAAVEQLEELEQTQLEPLEPLELSLVASTTWYVCLLFMHLFSFF
jgi:hypothetical protein